MAKLKEVVAFLDAELDIDSVPDYSGAMNGLQLENNGEVSKVGAAVDASLTTILKAIDEGVDLLIVHHGLFWQGAQKLVNAQYKKIKLAMDANLAIYSAHIPLDIHPVHGNNALLCNLIGMTNVQKFYAWKGIELGLMQDLQLDFSELVKIVEQAVDGKVHFCQGRSQIDVGRVGVITGGAGSEVQSMAEAGIDTFITGEGPHWSYPLAEELGINVIYAGHYATETFGVRSLMECLEGEYTLYSHFICNPTGL